MTLSLGKKKLILLYTVILLITSETLLLRLTPNIFPILNSIPLIFAGQILGNNPFFLSLILTNLFFFILYYNDIHIFEINFNLRFFFNFITISFFVYFLFYFLKLNKNKILSDDKVIINLNLLILFFLLAFNFFYFYRIDHQDLHNFILEFFSNVIKNQGLNKQIIDDNIIDFVIRIIPSINAFFLMTFLILNFLVTDLILKKLNFKKNFSLNLKTFSIPKKNFIFFNILILITTFLTGNLKLYFISASVVLSFLIFYQGLIYTLNFMEKFKVNVFLKILIIFLLFIFLGYVLFLSIFIIGYVISFKKFLKKS